ncbi:Uncharacterized protein SCF082_LOCUS22192 [Durusdinium trenchii]|uniref:Nucleotidyltransferase n=1 Tax=Durusdinium trenchii TaxID=1381693 RepID=A0ABP0LEA9_9DINO
MAKPLLEVAKQADEFFMGTSPIHQAMSRLSMALGEMNIPFAIAGTMAANAHGYHVTTADVDVLIHREDLAKFKSQHIGLGWVDKFEGSKNVCDVETGVEIKALITGDFPGDGKPKPVAFPPPESVVEVSDDGIPYVSLKTLLELKLASGMTAPHRMQDFADAMNLIKANNLTQDYVGQLNPYVADKFRELWQAAQVVDDY